MKYNVGDRVRIKSIDWYNENKDEDGDVSCGEFDFVLEMSGFCGKVLTIDVDFEDETYLMKEDNDGFVFTSRMFEKLVDDGTLIERVDNNGIPFNEWLSYKGAFHVPDNYILKDDNGNEILTSKIFLEKKKEYPKTFLECCDVLNIGNLIERGVKGYKAELFDTLQKLYICRDAYWKIAGKENKGNIDYVICNVGGKIISTNIPNSAYNHILDFPTKEMRDAFYENFKEEIEICKELL